MIKRCELWYSPAESSYTFFPVDNKKHSVLLPNDAELIWTTEASSWAEACQKRNDFLRWEPYVPAAGELDSW